MAASLMCDEEMMEDSPCVDSDFASRMKEQRLLSEQMKNHNHPPADAYWDPAISNDPRVFQSMLKNEERQGTIPDYFKFLQKEINRNMRLQVTLWMFEVTEAEHMEQFVYLRAVQYLDNVLAVMKIERSHFQLLAAVCMLISSKVNGTVISPKKLFYYTAQSCTPDLLREWEMMVLGILKWDLFGLVATDFIPFILLRLPKELWDNPSMKNRIRTYTAFAATDFRFGSQLPSIVASVTIASALSIIEPKAYQEVLTTIRDVTNIEVDVLRSYAETLMNLLQEVLSEAGNSGPPDNMSCPGAFLLLSKSEKDYFQGQNIGYLKATTPTDLNDVQL